MEPLLIIALIAALGGAVTSMIVLYKFITQRKAHRLEY
jgi:hypothetical protein